MTQHLTQEAADIAADPRSAVADRLAAMLSTTSHGKRLDEALHTAATQLELLTPAALIYGPAGLYAGPVALVATGTILLVLAEGRRCITSYWDVADGTSIADGFAECIQIAAALDAPHGAAPFAVQHVVRRFGAEPGKPAADDANFDVRPVFGTVLAMLTTLACQHVLAMVEEFRSLGVCPALVVLVGPSSSRQPGTLSYAGPIILPLARYADVAADLAEAVP